MIYRDVLIADRRLCVLRTLASAPERRANHATLCDLLAVLGHSVSNEAMLADLAWLEEMGLVACEVLAPGARGCTVPTLTQRGYDVALGRAQCPGVRRPLPGDMPDPEASWLG